MPPEALGDHPRYGPRIDIFSFGNIALFTVTQLFPNPTAAVRADPDNPGKLIPICEVEPRSEVERRSVQMGQLSHQLGGESHPLVLLVTYCLDNDPAKRPSARAIMAELQTIRSQIDDPYEYMSKAEMIHSLRRRGPDLEAIQEPVEVSFSSKCPCGSINTC